jgi:flagellar hook protein FlgE
MAFNTALSGLRAASSDLEITGNNIANASTTGFKQSRAEFGDVYAASLSGSGGSVIGSGVLLQEVKQEFTQGAINFTDRPLDMAINGRGFFILSDSGEQVYSRAGIFGLDTEGYIVSNTGNRLQGYAADAQGNIQSGALTDLQVANTGIDPRKTGILDIAFNLDANQVPPALGPFDATDQNTFNHATSTSVFDSLGIPHVMSQYFVKTAVPNEWEMYVQIDGVDVGNVANGGAGVPFTVPFNSNGTLDTGAIGSIIIDTWDPGTGADVGAAGALPLPSNSNFEISVSSSTQFGSDFSVASINQDGFAAGQLTGIEVSENGVVFARFTNGESLSFGKVILADFANIEGLSPLGETQWAESFESGVFVPGEALTGTFGAIQSGALEDSNVDLSEELVRLIIAQRNFQASAKTIETSNAITQTVINIRS